MDLVEICIDIQMAATWGMVGVIWFVQVVHYPLFAAVGTSEFTAYEQQHQRLTTYVVAPLMLSEFATATAFVWLRPTGVPVAVALTGLVIWASTFVWQVPAHERLSQGFDAPTHRWLVNSNWLRTVLWSARGILLACLI